MPLPSLEQENGLPVSLSRDLTPEPSLPKDVAKDVLVSADPHSPFTNSFEFEESEEFERRNELDMCITTKVEHHDMDESETICFQESCKEEVEPTDLEHSDCILSMEYDSFS